jgi:hypothetical protein
MVVLVTKEATYRWLSRHARTIGSRVIVADAWRLLT